METCLKLQFTMPSAGAAGSEAVGLTIRPVEENITVAVTYDFRDTPLVLIGDANEGDEVTVTLLPYRIELAVAGKKVDEEWPAGRCLYTPSSPFFGRYFCNGGRGAVYSGNTAYCGEQLYRC